jgi:hypothetical protein
LSSIKKTEFDQIQIEVVEAALWLSTESAQQDGSDYKQLQKRHKEVVKVMNGIAKYFDNYTGPTNDPAVLAAAADASATTSTVDGNRPSATGNRCAWPHRHGVTAA